MKKILVCLTAFIIYTSLAAQDEYDKIIDEGITLHDRGDYAAALKKYDEVLARNAEHFSANYEKSYTLLAMKRYDECIAISKMLNEKFPDHKEAKNVYVNWGSAVDDKGDPSEALKIYDNGIRAFPDFYLLYYNKAVTYAKQGDRVNSVKCAQDALSKKPLHASSHNLLGLLMKGSNNIASLLATLTFLSVEPSGRRAEANLAQMKEILVMNVKKTGKNSVTISVTPDMLDTTSKDKENDFKSIELIVTLGAALDEDKKYKKETGAERLERKLESIIGMMDETKEGRKGFFWHFYAPFFIEMKSKKYLETYSHIAYQSSGDDDNNKWLEKNADRVKYFFDWLKEYDWD
jgi:hypothetical protein